MTVPWHRQRQQVAHEVLEMQDEIDAAVQANDAALAAAEETKEHTRRLSARVQRIHAALMQEGADNHFTERWERAWGGK